MNLLKNIAVAFSMYSKIPMPQFAWTKENMRYALCFFPLIGAAVGVCVWIWGQLSFRLPFGNLFVTGVFLLIPVIVTGGIHLDGLLDTSDALSSWQPRERRLEILSDSHAGAFAIIVCCSYFIAALAVWSEVTTDLLLVLAGGYCLSRSLSGFGIATFPCAKSSGLAATFADQADKKKCRVILLCEAIASSLFMIGMQSLCGILAVAAAWLTMLGCRKMCMNKFGGITGDTQGFFLQICELLMAFAAVIGSKVFIINY